MHRWRRRAVWIVGVIAVLALLGFVGARYAFDKLDASYQRAADATRQRHAQVLVDLVLAYADKTGHFPFAEHTADRPFMVLIGHSQEEEDFFAAQPVLARGARFANSALLESELRRVLGPDVSLPRDPQRVPTFAPNVYVYFVAPEQMTVAVHLFNPTPETIEYQWPGGRFHSHSFTYAAKPAP